MNSIESYQAYTDINLAYNFVQSKPRGWHGNYFIVVVIKNRSADDQLIIKHYTIWSAEPTSQNYNNAVILTYPQLAPREFILIEHRRLTNEMGKSSYYTTVRDFNNDTLVSLTEATGERFIEHYLAVVNTDVTIKLFKYRGAYWLEDYSLVMILENGVYKFAIFDIPIGKFISGMDQGTLSLRIQATTTLQDLRNLRTLLPL